VVIRPDERDGMLSGEPSQAPINSAPIMARRRQVTALVTALVTKDRHDDEDSERWARPLRARLPGQTRTSRTLLSV
jgi:hypothetical protein